MAAKNVKACGYVRVSTQSQVEKGTSIDEQKERITAYCKAKNWSLNKIYEDSGVSGSTDVRPALNQLLEDAEKGVFNVVVFYAIDRMGRSALHLLKLFERFHEIGIDIAAVTQEFVNTTDPVFGKFTTQIFSAIAELERNQITVRTKTGRRAKYRQKKSFPGPVPYAYIWNKERFFVEIDKERAEIYKQIVDWYLIAGLSTLKIAVRLTELQVPSPISRRRKDKAKVINRWTDDSVRRILRHECYTGKAIYLKHGYKQVYGSTGPYFTIDKDKKNDCEPLEFSFPPLISKERWNRIQARLDFNRRKPKKLHKLHAKDHFLINAALGRNFRCALCDSSIMSRVIRRKKDGPVRLRYLCNLHVASADRLLTSGKERCPLPSLESDRIDENVWEGIKSFLANPIKFGNEWLRKPNLEKTKSEIEMLNQKKASLNKKLKKLSRLIVEESSNRIINEYREQQHDFDVQLNNLEAQIDLKNQELISETNADEYLAELQQEIEDTKKRLIKARKRRDPNSRRKAIIYIKSIADKLDNLPFEAKRYILESIISPDLGGQIKVGLRPLSDFFEEGQLPEGTLDTMLPYIIYNGKVDVMRVKHIIQSIQNESLESNFFIPDHQRQMP